MDYKKHIGDGKLPNRYWVFHYDEKFVRICDSDYESTDNLLRTTKNSLLGEFKRWSDALYCADYKAFYPHVVIEDRITGMVYEKMVIVCPCCGNLTYETIEDIEYTRKFIEDKGLTFK